MIYLVWFIYLAIGLLLSFLIRSFFSSPFAKAFVFSFGLSLFCSIWFSFPGSNEISPAISIFLIETIEGSNNFYRILRPMTSLFFIIFLLDLLSQYVKAKN